MALPLANNASGGTNGTTVTTANSGGTSGNAFDTVTIGTNTTLTYDSTQVPRTGGLSYKLTEPATRATVYLTWSTALGTLSAGGRVAGRFYIRMSALPSENWSVLRFLNGATVLGGVRINTTGALQFEASGGSVSGTAGNTGMAINTWYRVEFNFAAMGGTGIATARWFIGDGTTAQGTDATTSSVSFGTLAPIAARLGMSGTTGMPVSSTFWVDDIQLNTTGMPGAAVVAETASPIIVGAAVVAPDSSSVLNPVSVTAAIVAPGTPVYETAVAIASSVLGVSPTTRTTVTPVVTAAAVVAPTPGASLIPASVVTSMVAPTIKSALTPASVAPEVVAPASGTKLTPAEVSTEVVPPIQPASETAVPIAATVQMIPPVAGAGLIAIEVATSGAAPSTAQALSPITVDADVVSPDSVHDIFETAIPITASVALVAPTTTGRIVPIDVAGVLGTTTGRSPLTPITVAVLPVTPIARVKMLPITVNVQLRTATEAGPGNRLHLGLALPHP